MRNGDFEAPSRSSDGHWKCSILTRLLLKYMHMFSRRERMVVFEEAPCLVPRKVPTGIAPAADSRFPVAASTWLPFHHNHIVGRHIRTSQLEIYRSGSSRQSSSKSRFVDFTKMHLEANPLAWRQQQFTPVWKQALGCCKHLIRFSCHAHACLSAGNPTRV